MKTLIWKVDKTVPTGCPDYKPDPYTGEYPDTHCLVYHYERITENKSLEFTTEKEAVDFASKAPLSCYDFKLDDKTLEDKRERPTTDFFGNLTTGGTTTRGSVDIKIN